MRARGLRPICRDFLVYPVPIRGLADASRPAEPIRRSTSGAPKAMVLPEPVLPRPSTSRPARTSGMVAAWIGNGETAPRSVSERTMLPPRPRSAKRDALDVGGLDGFGLESLEHDVILGRERLVLAVRVELAVATSGAGRSAYSLRAGRPDGRE